MISACRRKSNASFSSRTTVGAGGRIRADGFGRLILPRPSELSVRVRIEDGATAVLTIKSANPGLSRLEFEYPLPLGDAEALTRSVQGASFAKTRFRVPHAGRTWEVDVYSGENAGLVDRGDRA